MSIDCPWSIYSTLLALTFYIPFKTKHSLLSAGNRWASILINSPLCVTKRNQIEFCYFIIIVEPTTLSMKSDGNVPLSHKILNIQQTLYRQGIIYHVHSPTHSYTSDPWPFDLVPNRKYIQVCVQNVSDVNFTLAEVKLTEKQHASLELQSLNTKAQQVSEKQRKCTTTRLTSLTTG